MCNDTFFCVYWHHCKFTVNLLQPCNPGYTWDYSFSRGELNCPDWYIYGCSLHINYSITRVRHTVWERGYLSQINVGNWCVRKRWNQMPRHSCLVQPYSMFLTQRSSPCPSDQFFLVTCAAFCHRMLRGGASQARQGQWWRKVYLTWCIFFVQ